MEEMKPVEFYPKIKAAPRAPKEKEYWESIPFDVRELRKNIIKFTPFKDVVPLDVPNRWGIFAYENADEGGRSFFAATYFEMFEYFKCKFDRHFYEVIEHLKPCHLYYDVEYIYKEKDYDGDDLVKQLIELSIEKLKEEFGIDDAKAVVLGTDSKKKFSRHIIIRSNKKAFKDNIHVGKFVRDNITKYQVFQDIVDQGVYTKNRCFRLIWNSKRKKKFSEQLVPIDMTNTTALTSSLEFFESTLVSNAKGLELVGYEELDSAKSNGIYNPKANPLSSIDLSSTGIDDFCLKAFAPSGFVKKSDYSESFNSILLQIGGCRYCQRIGREHKSNSIYIVVKLTSGVAVQRCYDPDCRYFESKPISIPPKMLDGLRRKWDKFYVPQDNGEQNTVSTDIERQKPVKFLSSSSDEEIDEEEIMKNLSQQNDAVSKEEKYSHILSSSTSDSEDQDSIVED